jgi:hypothetical protein
MDLDPIVVLAYVGVALNALTLVAAAVVYAVFRIRRRRRAAPQSRSVAGALPEMPDEPIFVKPYHPRPRNALADSATP